MRGALLLALVFSAALYAAARPVAGNHTVRGLLDITLLRDGNVPHMNIDRAARVFTSAPPFTIRDGALITESDEETVIYDKVLREVRPAIHIAPSALSARELYPEETSPSAAPLVLHKEGGGVKLSKDGTYTEFPYSVAENVVFAESAWLRFVTDITPPENGYSLADLWRFLGEAGGALPPTAFAGGAFTPLEGAKRPRACYGFTLPGEYVPRIYMNYADDAPPPLRDSPFLFGVTPRLVYYRQRTDAPFSYILLGRVTSESVHRAGLAFAQAARRKVNIYVWGIIFPAMLFAFYAAAKITGVLAGGAAAALLNRREQARALRAAGAYAALLFAAFMPYMLFARAERYDIAAAAACGYYVVLTFFILRGDARNGTVATAR